MYPREGRTLENVKNGSLHLYGTATRTLLSIDYDPQDMRRQSFKPAGEDIAAENIIVFRVSYSIEYPEGDKKRPAERGNL
jgi:hypothetical protein